jgi:hypothetical protein
LQKFANGGFAMANNVSKYGIAFNAWITVVVRPKAIARDKV